MTSYIQDGPPPGGFPQINYKRNVPKGGPSILALILASVGAGTFGFYRVISENRRRQKAGQEEMDIRLALTPFLSAEGDVQANWVKEKSMAREEILMAGVEGWTVGESVYK